MVFSIALFWPLFSGQSPSCGWVDRLYRYFAAAEANTSSWQLTPSGLLPVEQIIFCELCEFSFLYIADRMDTFLLLKPTAAVDLQLTQLDNN